MGMICLDYILRDSDVSQLQCFLSTVLGPLASETPTIHSRGPILGSQDQNLRKWSLGICIYTSIQVILAHDWRSY